MCGRLALFALALQFYLSFAHIHADDIYGSPDLLLGSATAKMSLPTATTLRALPADSSSQLPDDICAICASSYLLGNSFVAEALQVAPPSAPPVLRSAEQPQIVFVAPRHAPFQSRAPPAA